MAIKEDDRENVLLEEDLSAQRMDLEVLSYLEEFQNEFEGWLERVRNRREKSVSLLDEVRGDLELSHSRLNRIS